MGTRLPWVAVATTPGFPALRPRPSMTLAVREVNRVLDLISRQRSENRIVVLVSHRLNDVFAVSDRVAVLKQGKPVSDDPIPDLTLSEVVQRIVA
jgi:ABC-type sugar transport system ATPase subunit